MNPIEQMVLDPKPKFCKNCTHLLGNRGYTYNWETWKCSKSRIPELEFNLISGEVIDSSTICVMVRSDESQCGKDGKWYEKYTPPQFLESQESKQLTSEHVDPPFYISKKKPRVTEDDLKNL